MFWTAQFVHHFNGVLAQPLPQSGLVEDALRLFSGVDALEHSASSFTAQQRVAQIGEVEPARPGAIGGSGEWGCAPGTSKDALP